MNENNADKQAHTKRVRKIISGVLIAVLLIYGGYALGQYRAQAYQAPVSIVGATVPTDSNLKTSDFSLFWHVWNTLNDRFGGISDKETTDQDKIYGAIMGLTDSYGDPYTTFFPPSESKQFEDEISGSFEGIGTEIDIVDDVLTIIAPLKGSPAEKAGIRAGDKIIKIDEHLTVNVPIDELISWIRGPRGTKVSLTVLHQGDSQPVVIEVMRDIVNIPVIAHQLLPDGTYVIRIYSFTANSADLFRTAVKSFQNTGSKRLIIDLRNNPGGYLDAAVDMASQFIPAGNIIVTEEFRDGKSEIYRSKGPGIIGSDVRIAVLINGGSASASEILAGALREHDRATLIGEQSFGKGSVQEYLTFSDGSSLKVTVAEWETPRGNSISKKGLTPDIAIEPVKQPTNNASVSAYAPPSDTDNQFKRAVEFVTTGK